jgi:uncharacterized membrane protein required for colicin V production
MNYLDFALIALVLICAFVGWRRGLIRTVYRMVSFFLALFVAHALYSPVAEFMRGTGLHSWLHDHISDLDTLPELPAILRPDVLEARLADHLTDLAMNALAIVAVFVLALLLLSVAGHALDIVGRLPVIRTFNQAGGLLFGLVLGAGLAWLTLIILTLPFAAGANPTLYELMYGSYFAPRVLGEVMP